MDVEKIKLIILDVDGVLTDGRIVYSEKSGQLKKFWAKDGFFIKHILPLTDLKIALITGSQTEIIRKRAEVLDISYVYQGYFDKRKAYQDLKSKTGFIDEQIAYMGDDWFDWPVMKQVGLKACPKDAVLELKLRADFISTKNGGEGCVREFLEFIIKQQGNYDKVLRSYFS